MGVTRFLPAVCFVLLLAGCQSDPGFPEDQDIDGPFQITTEWQTIRFEQPLEINAEAIQSLNIVVDSERYDSNFDYENEDRSNVFNLRRKKDGVVVKPKAVLIGDGGQEVSLHPTGSTALYSGGVTVGMSTFDKHYSPIPPFPEEIKVFESVRIRSNVPFTAEQLRWWVSSHADHHRCGNRRCTWWDNLFN